MESIACVRVPLTKVRRGSFCFRHVCDDAVLTQSIKARGMLQPLSVVRQEKSYLIVDGHRRFAALKKMKRKTADCLILSVASEREQFFTALTLNQRSRYTEMEICDILEFAEQDLKFSDESLLGEVLPLLGLTPSLKILRQYREAARLPQKLKSMIRLGQVSFQGAVLLIRLAPLDLNYLISRVLPRIKPSASQLGHLSEWWRDLAAMKKKPLNQILQQGGVIPAVKKKDVRQRTDHYYQSVRSLRFPLLAAKEKAFWAAMKPVFKGGKGLDLRAPDHFEQEGFFLQMHVRDAQSFEQIERQIEELKKHSPALFDTLL